MDITPANLSFFFTALETRFWQAFNAAESWSSKIATEYPVGTEQWVSGWIGMLDKMRVWQGPRVVRTPAPQTYMVQIQPFELTEGIDKFKLADDTYGIYFPVIQHMGEQGRKLSDYQLRDLLHNQGFWTGAAQNGTDGVAHWSASHPVDFYDASKGTYPNDFGTAGVSINGITVGGTFSTNAFNTLWSEMASRKNESGESFGLLPNLSMFAPQLKAPATTILQAQYFAPPVMGTLGTGASGTANAPFAGAMENPLRGWTDLFINPDIASLPTAWYMLVTNRVIKPFSWLLRQAPTVTQRVSPQDPAVFDSHTFIFGSEARGAPAWGLPFLSSRSGYTPS